MSPLLSCQSISKSFGSKDLFEDLSVSLFPGDIVGLIGPNGAGKSTFLKLLAGIENPDVGQIIYNRGLRVGYVPQQIEDLQGSVEEVVESAVGSGYEKHAAVRKILGELGFNDPEKAAESLSGGWKRRLSIAKALVIEPDVILLDEPTNHLDLDSILWLESFLRRSKIPLILTSHDRVFLDNVCTKMWELSHRYPGGVFVVDGAYAEFEDRRETFLDSQRRQERGLHSKLRREEEWLKRSPKARTTKSRSRIQEAARLKHEHAAIKLRNIETKAALGFESSKRKTKKLVVAKNLSKSFGDTCLFSGMDISLSKGDRLGIVGDNGSGKSTLLKILAGEMGSDSGTIKIADDLSLFLFDQHRENLDLELPLRRGLSPMGDTVQYRGKSIHVNGWCERFLFKKERLDLPMKQLSGGERARVLIARLMTKPADILFLDEPTNDLDIDTLEVLEQSLDDFPGAVVLISHDRAMMDRVADRLIVLGHGKKESFNDTESWLKWRKEQKSAQTLRAQSKKEPFKKKKGLSYKEQREIATIEQKIIDLEAEERNLKVKVENPTIQADSNELKHVCNQLSKIQSELEATFLRWQELENH